MSRAKKLLVIVVGLIVLAVIGGYYLVHRVAAPATVAVVTPDPLGPIGVNEQPRFELNACLGGLKSYQEQIAKAIGKPVAEVAAARGVVPPAGLSERDKIRWETNICNVERAAYATMANNIAVLKAATPSPTVVNVTPPAQVPTTVVTTAPQPAAVVVQQPAPAPAVVAVQAPVAPATVAVKPGTQVVVQGANDRNVVVNVNVNNHPAASVAKQNPKGGSTSWAVRVK